MIRFIIRIHLYRIALFCCTVFMLSSCVPQKKIVYLQSDDKNISQEYIIKNKKNILIEPFDELYITVNTLDQVGYNFFKQENTNTPSNEASLSLLGYTVNDSGFVSLPIVGKVKVQGYTLDQAAKVIQEVCKNALNGPIVSVRFVNNTITILGEVQRPGTFSYTKEQLSIFRAIGLAGDITEYGNRRSVVLIREMGKRTRKYYLDLTKDDIISSDLYYLRPNDILYVEPLKRRRWGVKNFNDLPFNLIITSINTAIATYIVYHSYIKK